MCKGTVDSDQQPLWRLEENGSTSWRLVVSVAGTPQVDLSESALRLSLAESGKDPTILPVPEHALPVDLETAHCRFSRKRRELIVEWSRCAKVDGPVNVSHSEVAGCAGSHADHSAPTAVGGPANDVHSEAAGCAGSHADHSAPSADGEAAGRAGGARADEGAPTLTAEEWRAQGNAAVKSGDMEEAVRCYTAGLGAGGGDVAMLCSNRSHCLQKLGRYVEAAEDARRCVALRPDFFKGYLRGAAALRALGRPEEALAFLKRCPPNDEAAALVTELRPEAEAAEKARISSLGGAERAKEEGNVLFRKGLFEAALAKYTEALRLCGDAEGTLALSVRNNRAACHHQLSDYKAVVADASFVLEHEPNNMKALMRRMLALEPLERYETALDDSRAILRQDPRHEAANKVQHRLGKLVRDLRREVAAGA